MKVSKWLLFTNHKSAVRFSLGAGFLWFFLFLIYLISVLLDVEYCKEEWSKDIFIHSKLRYL